MSAISLDTPAAISKPRGPIAEFIRQQSLGSVSFVIFR